MKLCIKNTIRFFFLKITANKARNNVETPKIISVLTKRLCISTFMSKSISNPLSINNIIILTYFLHLRKLK